MSNIRSNSGTPVPASGGGFILDDPAVNRWVSVVGRIAIAYLFCLAARFHLTFGWDMTIRDMTARGIPFPEVLNVVAMLVSGGLSLALLFNFKPRYAALGLALYTLTVSIVMFGPQNAEWETTRVYFMKDMAIFGALLAWSCTLAVRGDKRLP